MGQPFKTLDDCNLLGSGIVLIGAIGSEEMTGTYTEKPGLGGPCALMEMHSSLETQYVYYI